MEATLTGGGGGLALPFSSLPSPSCAHFPLPLSFLPYVLLPPFAPTFILNKSWGEGRRLSPSPSQPHFPLSPPAPVESYPTKWGGSNSTRFMHSFKKCLKILQIYFCPA